MLFRVTLVFVYFVIIFLGSRLVDVSVSLVEVTSLTLLCELLPKALLVGGVCSRSNQQKQQEDVSTAKTPNQKEKANTLDDHNSLFNEEITPYEGTLDVSDGGSIDFTSYEHFVENVEDTKASVWVVWVRPGRNRSKNEASARIRPDQCDRNESVLNVKDWNSLAKKLLKYGIRTGTYKCSSDTKLCKKHNIKACSILMSMPAGVKPKGKVATYLYRNKSRCNMYDGAVKGKMCLFEWIKSKLKSKVTILNRAEELSSTVKPDKQSKKVASHSNLKIIFESAHRIPPLLISALSVRFTGRVKFLQMKPGKKRGREKQDQRELHSMYAVTSFSNYSYGYRRGEKFDYSNINMFLKTLHPEANDIFLVTLILINMSCLLELFVQKGGPLKRMICFVWIVLLSNSLLIFVWLPLLKILQFPETGPVIDFFLNSLQAIMFSEVAAMIRKDFVLLSQHFGIFGFGLMVYGSAVGYIRFKISNRGLPRPTLTSLWNEDVNEIREFFESLLTLATPPLSYYDLEERLETFLQRLAMPDLWLHPLHSNEYVRQLITWNFCKNIKAANQPTKAQHAKIKANSDTSKVKKCDCHTDAKEVPHIAISSVDCVICLEQYKCFDPVKLLPCGHFFHTACIDPWLLRGVDSKNRKCPVCRWPANKRKRWCYKR
eukprot:Seg629.5 transcript_id=Seg629.5/GoldUCD/mRNA.D3Y31 product="E3 ubiquitin-protein ligase RNF103" protein_id=Seg629.5/GoldUCD/D3Y31